MARGPERNERLRKPQKSLQTYKELLYTAYSDFGNEKHKNVENARKAHAAPQATGICNITLLKIKYVDRKKWWHMRTT